MSAKTTDKRKGWLSTLKVGDQVSAIDKPHASNGWRYQTSLTPNDLMAIMTITKIEKNGEITARAGDGDHDYHFLANGNAFRIHHWKRTGSKVVKLKTPEQSPLPWKIAPVTDEHRKVDDLRAVFEDCPWRNVDIDVSDMATLKQLRALVDTLPRLVIVPRQTRAEKAVAAKAKREAKKGNIAAAAMTIHAAIGDKIAEAVNAMLNAKEEA